MKTLATMDYQRYWVKKVLSTSINSLIGRGTGINTPDMIYDDLNPFLSNSPLQQSESINFTDKNDENIS